MARKRKRGKWTPQIRARFLKVIRETGNAREAYRRIGHENMFRRRRRREPDFARDWAAAEAEADARFRDAPGPFSGAVPTSYHVTVSDPDPAKLLKPAEKKKPVGRDYAIRRTRGGRTQIALSPERNMTPVTEAEFFALLRETGNFSASARALGFQPASLFQRAQNWPAFAEGCKQALGEAEVKLDYALIAHAHILLRDPGELRAEAEEQGEATFDPVMAMRILSFLDRRRTGGTLRGRRRKGPPERSFEEAVESILAKIAAIERHEKWKKEQEKQMDPPPHEGGEGISR